MNLPELTTATCSLDFLCGPPAPVWPSWLFLGWMALMVIGGTLAAVAWRRR